MTSIWLLLLGMVLVVGGILWLRLHPFLALLAGGLAIAAFTPNAAFERYAASEVMKKTPNKRPNAEQQAAIEKSSDALKEQLAMERLADGFGETCASVGILIAMASIIGTCLLESGAAQRIVASLLGFLGATRAALAFLGSGFLLAIPVFFDTVFYLLVPIAKAMRRTTGKHYLLYILAIVAGGTMAHSLVPPTPGPLFVAGALSVDLGTMMLAGFIVGSLAAAFGYGYAVFVDRRYDLPLRDTERDDEIVPTDAGGSRADGSPAGISKTGLPPLWLSLLPIAVPITLLAMGSLVDLTGTPTPAFLNDKNLALVMGAMIGLLMLGRYGGHDRKGISKQVQHALTSGASIILITAAGGAFGAVLRQTGIGPDIAGNLGESASWLALPVVFLVTAIVRTAQGSATVAMFTAAPVAYAFVSQVTFHPVYLALAIGCGSKPIPWMNDSGFWIITRMTGMKETETLRYVTPMMSLMGVVGLIITMIGAWLFPLV